MPITLKSSGLCQFLILLYRFMIFDSSVSDVDNNITRFQCIIQLLKLDYSVIEAATISSLIGSLLSYGTINLVVKYM